MSLAEVHDEPTAAIRTYDTPLQIPGEPWFVVRTAPSYVDTLRCMAADAQVRLWSPVYARRTRVGPSKKRAVVHAPIFPGYVFVPRSHAGRLRLLPTHRYQFLRMPSLWDVEFVKLPWRVVHQLAEQERKACEIELEDVKAADQFAVGDVVKTQMGPLRVTGIVGNKLHMDAGAWRVVMAAAVAEKVA
jgi:transcription antitermination factor NusG